MAVMLALLTKSRKQNQPPKSSAKLIVPKRATDNASGQKPRARRIIPDRALDLATQGRAAAIHKEEFDKWELAILEIAKDRSLSPSQRKAAIAALRQRQRYEATTARKRYLETEKQIIKALRRTAKEAAKPPPPPTSPRR